MAGSMSDFYSFNVDELLLPDTSLPASCYSPHAYLGTPGQLPTPVLAAARSPSFQSVTSAGSDTGSAGAVALPAAPAPRKRRRKSHACQTCVTAKAACTDGVPCARCIRLHRADTCTVANADKQSIAGVTNNVRRAAATATTNGGSASVTANASVPAQLPAARIPDDLWTVDDTSADSQLMSHTVLQLWVRLLDLSARHATAPAAPREPLTDEELGRYSHLMRSICATCVGDDLHAAKRAIADTWYSHATPEQRTWMMDRRVIDDFSASPSQPIADLVHTPSLPTVVVTLVNPTAVIGTDGGAGVYHSSLQAIQHHAIMTDEQLEALMKQPGTELAVPRSVVVNEAFIRCFGWTQSEVKEMYADFGELGLNAFTGPHAKFRQLRSHARKQSDLLLSDQVDWSALADAADAATADWRSLWLAYYAAAQASPEKQQVTRKVTMTCKDGKAVACVWNKSDHMLSMMRARMSIITLQPIPD